jgi:hypothetical protein
VSIIEGAILGKSCLMPDATWILEGGVVRIRESEIQQENDTYLETSSIRVVYFIIEQGWKDIPAHQSIITSS